MIGLMVRQVTLEEMEPAVDVVNQSALAATSRIAPMPPQAIPYPIGQFVLDVAAAIIGDFDPAGAILDAFEDSTLAFPQFVEEIRFHSKASVA